MRNEMKKIYQLVLSIAVFACSQIPAQSEVHAISCGEYSQSPSSQSPSSFTILDTDIGTEAYQRLLPYSSGGHQALGMAIAAKFNFFDNCEYIGIGIGDGSGGNGFRPNYTIWMWRDGVDVDIARAAIYELVGASVNPIVTNGDCNISCDGTFGRQFDGSFEPASTTTTTTTTTPHSVNIDSSGTEPQGSQQVTNEQASSPTSSTTATIAVVANAALANSTGFITIQAKRASFKNCSEVNAIYPWGIAKSLSAAKKQKNYPVNNPHVSKSLYQKLAKMDRDKDLTVCEK
jgi:hypothetical protein